MSESKKCDAPHCTQPATVECRIGKCAQLKQFCSYHYEQAHLSQDEQKQMEDEEWSDFHEDDPEFDALQAEIERRKDEPLNTELRCWIQPHTLERLEKYVSEQKRSNIGSAVNEALRVLLYDVGY